MAVNIELPNNKDALNEYFKLKLKYEKENTLNKKKIMNNSELSKREKRSEFLKLKPKCINCKRPGGTKFENIYFPSNDKEDAHRQYSAVCGIIADPCNLRIKISVGNVELLPTLLNEMQSGIKDLKNDIIDNKNKLLFGYLTSEEVLPKFEELQEHISEFSALYESYIETYNELVDNDQKKNELNESITESFYKIEEIKECIKKMNETNNIEYARDAVTIYTTVLQPLLDKIKTLKYNENMICHNSYTNTCNLIQNRYSIENLSYASYKDTVVSFEKGERGKNGERGKKDKNKNQTPEEELFNNEPIYGKDDITWSNPEYSDLWKEMSSRLKNALRTNPEWMKDFMANCVTARKNKKPCAITSPKDLKLPPELMPNGEYNFGVKIYNDAFNKLPKQTQQTYFTLNVKRNDGTDDWSKFVDAVNELVAKEIGFKGYF